MNTVSGISQTAVTSFRRRILRFYERHGRTFPFRQTRDPYRITISEFMLQQTQIQRVIPRYVAWLQRWPDWRSLAGATRRELLHQWSGLGYNRRALYLGEVAGRVVNEHGGVLPDSLVLLLTLPGFGP
jgi:A/G-specific adenine glycosylase